MRRLFNSHGQTLVEIAIGMTILSVVLLSAASVAVSASRSGTNSYLQFLGTQYAQQGLEQMRMYRAVDCPSKCSGIGGSATIPGIGGLMDTWNGNWYINTSGGGGNPDDPLNWRLAAPTSSDGEPIDINDDPTGKFKRYISITNSSLANVAAGHTDSNIDVAYVTVHVTWTDQGGQPQEETQSTTLTDWKAAE